MTTHSQTTTRTSCAGCASYRETQIRQTEFVRQRCHAGGKPMLPEFALRSGGICGPSRKLYLPVVDTAQTAPCGTGSSPVQSSPPSGVLPPHLLPWYAIALPGGRSPDGAIRHCGGAMNVRSVFELRIGTLPAWSIAMFDPAVPVPPNQTRWAFVHEQSPTSWLDVVYIADAAFPNELAGIYRNVMTNGRLVP